MKQIITVEEYRNALIEYYKYDYDKNTYGLRKTVINNLYNDEYLERIITETTEMYKFLFEKIKTEGHEFEDKVYTSIDIEERQIHITNGCVGGWASDTIYIFIMGTQSYYISDHIIRLYFPNFDIYLHEDIVERMEEEDIGSFFPIQKLFIKCSKDVYEKQIGNINLEDIKKLEKIPEQN